MINSTQLDGVALVVGVSDCFPEINLREALTGPLFQSGSGIGREAAFSIAEAGAKVVVFADMNTETAKTSSEESKKVASNKEYQTTIFEMNVQDDKSVQAMVDFVVKEFGRLDYAINAAGVRLGNLSREFLKLQPAVTDYLLRSTMACMRLFPRQTSKTLIAS